jgi:hypothetical protein
MFLEIINDAVPVFAAIVFGVFFIGCFLSTIGYFDVWEKRYKRKRMEKVMLPQRINVRFKQ